MAVVRILELKDQGDDRGSSFAPPIESIAFLTAVRNIHLTTLKPGYVRGNHYHARQREIIVVIHSDTWQFCWDTGVDTPRQTRRFSGCGAILLHIEPFASHSIENTGSRDLTILACSEQPYDPQDADVHPRPLI